MLTLSTLEANVVLATKFAKLNRMLTPKTDGPVAQLVNAGYMPTPSRVIDGEMPPVAPFDNILEGSVHKNQQGICEHDMVMDELVEVVSKTVRLNLDQSRNCVNPMVKSVVEATQKGLDHLENVGAPRVSIKPIVWASIWANPMFHDIISRYEEAPVEDMALSLVIPGTHNIDKIREYTKTGITRLDKELEDFLNTLDDELITFVFNSVFGDPIINDGSNETTSSRLVDVVSNFTSGPDGKARTLLVHMFARNMINDVPEGVNMPLQEYKAYMATIMAQSGRALNRICARRTKDVERNQLLPTGYPGGDGMVGYESFTINVNGDVYGKWLEAGGEPESIMGAFVSDKETGFQALLENVAMYKSAWQRHERVLNIRVRTERHNNAVNALKTAMLASMVDLDEKVRVAPDSVYRARLLKNIEGLKDGWHSDLYRVVRSVVCDVYFPHTDALTVLEAIDEAAEANPGIDIREAGYLAVIGIVSEWVAKLIQVNVGQPQ